MKATVEVNHLKNTVEVDRCVDILNMHIEKLLRILGQDLNTRMTLRNYIEIVVYDESGDIWGSALWVPPWTQDMATSDGHTRKFDFPVFVQIVEVNPGIPGLELEPISPLSPTNRELLYDINKPSGMGFEIIAIPSLTDQVFAWRFNAGNGLIAFYEQYHKHKLLDRDGNTRVVLYHNHYMGYHFDRATDDTILRYYRQKGELL